MSSFGRCRSTGCSQRAINECHSALIRIHTLIKNTTVRRLANWKSEKRRAERIRRQLVCMLSRMVRVRDRIIKSSLHRANRSLRSCKKASCRNRGLRRIRAVRRHVASLLKVTRDATAASAGVKGVCVKSLVRELRRESKVVSRVVKTVRRVIKAEKKAVIKARKNLLNCAGARCVKHARRTVRREKRVIRAAKKEVRKAQRVVTKLVVREIERVTKLKAKVCNNRKCRRGVRKATRLEKVVLKAVKLSRKTVTKTAKKVKKVISKAVRKVTETRCDALRVVISTHTLERNLCGDDRACSHRHSARIHTAMADLLVLKNCSAASTTKTTVTETAVDTTAPGSVARDMCDDEISVWNAERETLNRKLAAQYEVAAKCTTAAATKLSLLELTKLHRQLRLQVRPKCAATFMDSVATKAASSSTTATTARAAAGTTLAATKAAVPAATTALPSNVKIVETTGTPREGQILLYRTPVTLQRTTKAPATTTSK